MLGSHLLPGPPSRRQKRRAVWLQGQRYRAHGDFCFVHSIAKGSRWIAFSRKPNRLKRAFASSAVSAKTHDPPQRTRQYSAHARLGQYCFSVLLVHE